MWRTVSVNKPLTYQGPREKYRLVLNEVNPQLFLDQENGSQKALNTPNPGHTLALDGTLLWIIYTTSTYY